MPSSSCSRVLKYFNIVCYVNNPVNIVCILSLVCYIVCIYLVDFVLYTDAKFVLTSAYIDFIRFILFRKANKDVIIRSITIYYIITFI